MPPVVDNWLIDRDVEGYASGFAAVLNEDAPFLDHSLFHYTTEAGLDGVLRTRELWATSVAYMDDPREVKLSWTISSDIASSWSGLSRHFDRIVRAIPDWSKTDSERERYVVSFCSEPDYLLAWRAYAADSAGYCIEFMPSAFKASDGWYLARVEYNADEHIKEIRRLLSRLERAYLSVERTVHQQFLTEQTAITTAMWMSLVAPTFKDARYASEQEWRLIRTQLGDGEDPPMTVAHRLRGGEAVPYVARPIGVDASTPSVGRILCGARVSDKTVADVRRLGQSHLPGCDVVQSGLEFRRR